jgi:hypothetical protein
MATGAGGQHAIDIGLSAGVAATVLAPGVGTTRSITGYTFVTIFIFVWQQPGQHS